MPISDIVNVQITRETQTVSQAGFGTLMILGTHKSFNERIKYYSNITEVGADFNSSSLEYISAQDVFAQSPRPVRLAIGRRASDDVTISVVTGQAPFNYTVTINGTDETVPTAPTSQQSNVVLDADLVTDNYVGVTLNASVVETVNSVITFDIDFDANSSVVSTINGTPLGAVVWNANQSDTLDDVATAIQGDASVTTATQTGAREITVIFALVGANVIDSVVVGGAPTQPVATIFGSQFLFDTDHDTTMNNIAVAMTAETGIDEVTVGGDNERTLFVSADPNDPGVVNAFTVNGGASQAVVTIVTALQPVSKLSIAESLVVKIVGDSGVTGVTATDNLDGTFTLSALVSGVPYTVGVSTNIINPNEAKVTVTQAKPSTTYQVTIAGVVSSYTSSVNVTDNETIALGLVTAINLNPNVSVVATDNTDGTFTLNSLSTFSISVSPVILNAEFGLAMGAFTALDTVTEDLDAIVNENNDWYALSYTGRTQSDVEEIALWVETQVKIFGTASDDPVIINSAPGSDITSIAAVLNQSGYTRSFVMYHDDADSDFPECAWFGKTLPTTPGSITWKFKTLASISYSDLTTTQSSNARGKQADTYEFIGGVGVTREGTMASGEFIDIIRGIDWLTARIQEFVYSLLVNSPKVPYTDAGIASVEAEVRRALDLAVSNDFISPDPKYTVTVPLASSVSPANKAARLLQDVVFNATLSGAIHAVEITGTVSL